MNSTRIGIVSRRLEAGILHSQSAHAFVLVAPSITIFCIGMRLEECVYRIALEETIEGTREIVFTSDEPLMQQMPVDLQFKANK